MTWEIAVGIFALVAFVISICKLVANNTKALTALQVTCENIGMRMDGHDSNIKDIQEKLGDHETRITVLEKNKKAGA